MSKAFNGLADGQRGAFPAQDLDAPPGRTPSLSLTTQPHSGVAITATACTETAAEPLLAPLPDADGYLVAAWPPVVGVRAAGGTLWIRDLRVAAPSPRVPGARMIVFHLSRDAIDGLADRAGVSRIADLRSSPEPWPDPVAANIAAMLLPHFASGGRNAVFVDNLLLALGVHLLRAYGEAAGDERPVKPGGLAPWQEARAKAFMIERLDETLSIERVAEVCGLSSSRFSRAFRITTARPPYRWYLEQRIERAKALMADGRATLPDIALACGFSDQSQFTVAFGRIAGMSPGAWRARNPPAR